MGRSPDQPYSEMRSSSAPPPGSLLYGQCRSASVAEARLILLHAGDDSIHVRYLRRTQPVDIGSAGFPLFRRALRTLRNGARKDPAQRQQSDPGQSWEREPRQPSCNVQTDSCSRNQAISFSHFVPPGSPDVISPSAGRPHVGVGRPPPRRAKTGGPALAWRIIFYDDVSGNHPVTWHRSPQGAFRAAGHCVYPRRNGRRIPCARCALWYFDACG
jgi:hypothetical protein